VSICDTFGYFLLNHFTKGCVKKIFNYLKATEIKSAFGYLVMKNIQNQNFLISELGASV